MTTRYYKLPGSNEYVTWDYLHNTFGYSTSATETVGYKSVVNWGTGVGTGYCTDTTDYEAEWFVQGETGWAGLNGLAWECNVYPGSAEDIRVERSGTESNAASMTFDGVEYWLVESEIGDAWWPRSRWEQQGWAIVEDHVYDFILVDSTTGRITYGVENLTEIEFTPTGYFTINEGNEVIFVEQSPFPVVCTFSSGDAAQSIAPDAGFDTGLPYYASKLYIVTTDDGQDETLYGWEANEAVEPVVVLPTVSVDGDWGSGNWLYANLGGANISVWAGNSVLVGSSGDSANPEPVSYNTSKQYAVIRWGTYQSSQGSGRTEYAIINNSGQIYAKNVTSENLYLYAMRVAVCSSNQATVVTVYNSSLVAYNAFKYTANGIDYYYVLDETQTDWTDDLSSIGYSLSAVLEILLALRYDPSTSQWKTVAFDQTPSTTENYWWGCVIDQADVTALQTIGLTYHDPSSIWGGSKFTGPIGNVVYNSGYSYEVLALYSDMGTTEVAQSLLPSLTLEPLNRDNTDLLAIWSKNVIDTTSVKTWKVRITKL